MRAKYLFLISLLIFLSVLIKTTYSSSIAIDFGSDYITVSIVRPRKVIELVENPQSKTKTEQSLYINGNDKIFGRDSLTKRVRYPSHVFHHIHEFFGITKDSEHLKNYLKNYYQNYDIISDPNNGQIKFKTLFNKEDYTFNPQEIMAIMLKYIKEYAEKFGQTNVDEFIITVPNYFGYKQHEVINDAASLSGMRLIRIIHDNSAAAVKYFNDIRLTKEEKLYIFYNMGASHTQVSLISASSTFEGTKRDMKENQHIKVIGEEYMSIGGRDFDYKLVEVLYRKYKKKNGIPEDKELTQEYVEKLLPYARKYKEILSANKEININILGLDSNEYEDTLTREEFLEACKEYLDKVYDPIKNLLEKNEKTMKDISMIEFIGGGHRIPAIKERIEEFVPKEKIGVHLNGDDSVALGAGIYLSNIKGMINKVNGIQKKVELQNYGYIFETRIRIRNIDIVENEKVEESKREKLNICEENYNQIAFDCIRPIYKNAAIIKPYNNFVADKSVSFDYDGDLLIELLQNNNTILQYKLNRIRSGALKELKKNNKNLVENSSKAIKIKLVFKMDKLGLIKMTPEIIYKTKLYYMYIPPSQKNPKMVFRYVSDFEEIPVPLTQEQTNELLNKLNDTTLYSESEKAKLSRIIKSGKVNNSSKEVQNTKYFPLKDEETILPFPMPMNEQEIKKSKEILKEIWNVERKKLQFQEIRNSLENFIYSKREWAENKNVWEKYAKEKEIYVFKKKLEELKEWFDKNAESATERDFKKKTAEAKDAFKIFADRKDIEKKRENSIKFYRSEIASATKQSSNWIKERPWITSYYNESLVPLLENLTVYMDDIEEKQSKLKEYELPVFNKEEMMKKLEKLKETMSHLRKIPRPIIEKDKTTKKEKSEEL